MVRVLDDDRPGGKIAQPFALPVGEQDDHSDPVPVRQKVDDPHDVADTGLHESERLTPVPNRPKPECLLADGLT